MRGLGPLGSLALMVVLAMTILVAGTLFYGPIFGSYSAGSYANATDNTSYAQSYAKINQTSNAIIQSMAESETTETNPLLVLFQGGFAALKQVLTVLDAVKDMASGILAFLSEIGGASFAAVAGILLTALILYFAFNFLQIVLGREI